MYFYALVINKNSFITFQKQYMINMTNKENIEKLLRGIEHVSNKNKGFRAIVNQIIQMEEPEKLKMIAVVKDRFTKDANDGEKRIVEKRAFLDDWKKKIADEEAQLHKNEDILKDTKRVIVLFNLLLDSLEESGSDITSDQEVHNDQDKEVTVDCAENKDFPRTRSVEVSEVNKGDMTSTDFLQVEETYFENTNKTELQDYLLSECLANLESNDEDYNVDKISFKQVDELFEQESGTSETEFNAENKDSNMGETVSNHVEENVQQATKVIETDLQTKDKDLDADQIVSNQIKGYDKQTLEKTDLDLDRENENPNSDETTSSQITNACEEEEDEFNEGMSSTDMNLLTLVNIDGEDNQHKLDKESKSNMGQKYKLLPSETGSATKNDDEVIPTADDFEKQSLNQPECEIEQLVEESITSIMSNEALQTENSEMEDSASDERCDYCKMRVSSKKAGIVNKERFFEESTNIDKEIKKPVDTKENENVQFVMPAQEETKFQSEICDIKNIERERVAEAETGDQQQSNAFMSYRTSTTVNYQCQGYAYIQKSKISEEELKSIDQDGKLLKRTVVIKEESVEKTEE